MNSTSRLFAATSLLALCVASGCSPADKAEQQHGTRTPSTVIGTIENNEIDEASGLARSQRSPDVLWVINDDGPSVLHAIDSTGGMLGRVKLIDASNRDWEDLASFTLDGTPYLLLADIGDNKSGNRKDVRFLRRRGTRPLTRKRSTTPGASISAIREGLAMPSRLPSMSITSVFWSSASATFLHACIPYHFAPIPRRGRRRPISAPLAACRSPVVATWSSR